MVKKILVILFLITSSGNLYSQKKNICNKWDILDSMITNLQIEEDEAFDLMKEYNTEVRSYFRQHKGVNVSRNDWVFPLKNYTSVHYRDYGNDYKVAGYDYFQGSNTKGHPAHDLMIPDKNKDLLARFDGLF